MRGIRLSDPRSRLVSVSESVSEREEPPAQRRRAFLHSRHVHAYGFQTTTWKSYVMPPAGAGSAILKDPTPGFSIREDWATGAPPT